MISNLYSLENNSCDLYVRFLINNKHMRYLYIFKHVLHAVNYFQKIRLFISDKLFRRISQFLILRLAFGKVNPFT